MLFLHVRLTFREENQNWESRWRKLQRRTHNLHTQKGKSVITDVNVKKLISLV